MFDIPLVINLFISLIELGHRLKTWNRRTHVKFKIDKITSLKCSLEQHDVSKKGYSDKLLVYP